MPEFVAADGGEVSFSLLGTGRPPAIVLPGGPLRPAAYLGDLGGLPDRCPLAVLDLRIRRVDALGSDVEDLRRHLGLDQIDVLAHSAGAALALQYAAAHPQRIRRLVLITPSLRAIVGSFDADGLAAAIERRSDEPWYPSARAALDAQDAGDESPELELAAAPFGYGRWDAAAQRHAAQGIEQTVAGAAATYYAPGALTPEITRAALAAVDAPVLVVLGALDLLPTPAMADDLATVFRHAQVVTQPGAGHFPWLDDPDAFVAPIAAFLHSA